MSSKDHNHEKCSCNHEHSNGTNHDEDQGCSCEKGLLEDIDSIKEERSKKPLLIFAVGAIILAIGYIISQIKFNLTNDIDQDIISQLIYLLVAIIAGREIIKYGISSLLKKEVKIELLTTIAAIGAFLLGDGAEGASLMLLFFLANYLEDYSLDRSKRSLAKLVNLSPDLATIKKIEGGVPQEFEVNVKDLNVGDIVVVKPGDKIPIDGVITKGITSVNQASITGESLAVSKTEGDEVYASTINEEGYIEIEVSKTSNETIFSKIIGLIKESENKKAKVDLFIDKFAKYYTPAIIAIAAVIATIPPLLFDLPLNDWIYRGLVLLVIGCPCALAISTPVSMVSAITAGTKKGIIIKGGEYIEELAKIKAIMFDKTGTLTEGKLEISNIQPINDFEGHELIEIACSLESKSKHPIAKTFNEYQKNNKINLKEVQNFQSIAGKGLKGDIHGKTYYIGKKELFDYNENLNKEIDSISSNSANIAKTSVIVGDKNKIIGFISLQDKIREESPQTISKIKSKSIKTMILTGDNPKTAETVAKTLGVDKFYPNLLPEDKVKFTEQIANEYKDVAMVGDGVNDSPSLARANVGIAMGMDGADVALETADIVLMHDNISMVNYLLDLSKKTMTVIKENVGLSLSVKSILAILGVLGHISLWEAILIGDMGLTLIVVGNALRIGGNDDN
jgi:Cd2+/Zn2+-exporting ATPase